MEELRELVHATLPNYLANLAGAVTIAVAGALYVGVDIRAIALAAAAGVWLGCAYLAFKRTPSRFVDGRKVWRYPRWRRWALAGLIIIPLLAAGGAGYHFYQQAQPPKVIILIANLDGPEPQRYRVTETVLARLRAALQPYQDVQVEALGRAITEAEGSTVARAEGEKRKAAIVIWGWYGATAEAVSLSVHFEVLRPPKDLPELGPATKGQVQVMAVAQLESFAVQTRLSKEMAYLSLFTVGMARYAAEDCDGAIARFSDALSQTTEPVSALDRSAVHFYSAYAYYYKGDYDRAIADYNQAIKLKPDLAEAYNNRGIAYTDKGDYERAIADYNQAVKLNPDNAGAYNNRGNAYAGKGDYDRAIADYNQAIKLKPDDAKPYYNRGIAYYRKGDYERAIADYNQAIKLKPDLAEAYYVRGITYRQSGEKEKAIADFKKFLELNQDPYWRQKAEEQLKALGEK